jgi:hypothetical protein
MNIAATTSSVAEHFIARLIDAEVHQLPYPHVLIDNCFPLYYYDMMLAELPEDEAYTDRTFENRMMARVEQCGPFWQDLSRWMMTREVCGHVIDMFGLKGKFNADLRLVRDTEGYAIKPHTDIKAKAISLLFYLPSDDTKDGVGTSLYIPKDPEFTSDGTRRYEFDQFEKVKTAPFMPNTCLGFPRSNISFHGVRPINVQRRDVLLLNVYHSK